MRTTSSDVSGFTFVETLIVIGLLGLVATVALPNFLSAQPTGQNAGISKTRQMNKVKTVGHADWPAGAARPKTVGDHIALHNSLRRDLRAPADACMYEAGLTNSSWSLASFNGRSL